MCVDVDLRRGFVFLGDGPRKLVAPWWDSNCNLFVSLTGVKFWLFAANWFTVTPEIYIDSVEVHSQLRSSLEAVHCLLSQCFEQNTKKLHMLVWVEQKKQTRKKKQLSYDSWCCNLLVRNPSSVNVDFLCKGTKNQEKPSHWEVYLFRRQPSLTGPWVAGDGGLDEFASPVSPVQPMQADGKSSCQAHHTSQPAIIITDQLTSGPQ